MAFEFFTTAAPRALKRSWVEVAKAVGDDILFEEVKEASIPDKFIQPIITDSKLDPVPSGKW